MKLVISCPYCVIEGIDRNSVISFQEPRDDNIYKWTCPNGHDVVEVILHEKFELLYQFGATALLDGYSREAVSSFAAALERFHEFCIEVMLADSNQENLKQTWNFVAKQSERQLGAYLFMYLSKIGSVPPWKEVDKYVYFRNRVIHQGYIPLSEETMEYAKVIFMYIQDVSKILSQTCQTSLQQVLTNRSQQLREKAGNGPITWRHLKTMLDFNGRFPSGQSTINFEASMKQLKEDFLDGWSFSR